MTLPETLLASFAACCALLSAVALVYPVEAGRLSLYAWKTLQLEWINAYAYVGARIMHWKMRRAGMWMPPFRFVRLENRPRNR